MNKTIVRIQIKKLKELKSTLEEDLHRKESELQRLKQLNASETEKSVEKELKKSLNILRGLRKKLVKLKQENGSAYEQDIDPILKSIDKELNKNRKWKSQDTSPLKEESKEEEKMPENKEAPPVKDPKEVQNAEKFDTIQEEKELAQKVTELEKELALSDDEFEKRLIERLKKGKIPTSNIEIKTSKNKIEKGLRKEYVTKQKQVHKTKDQEIEKLRKENEDLSSYISRIKILLSS